MNKADNTNMSEKTGGFFVGAQELSKYLVETGEALALAGMEPKIIDINGDKYLFDGERLIYIKPIMPEDEPFPSTMRFFTLDGVVDYIENNTEHLIPDEENGERLILQVEDHKTVRLLSQPDKYSKRRHVIAECVAHAPEITYSRYMDVESFNTMLLSMFIPTESRETLFAVVKSLTKEQNCNTTDDGVSQVVTVKQGVSMASNVIFKNPVPLKPMRTFTEVDQPESNFTMRIDEDARAALFEADGGAWKNDAVANIKSYLETALYGCKNVVVIA